MTTEITNLIHLVGGGPGAIASTKRHFRTALAALPKRPRSAGKPLVAYVGAASGDNAGFRRMISGMMSGTRVEPVLLASKTAKVSAARTLLEDCDLIFMSGGDVHAGMQVLGNRGVDDDLRRLASAGKPMLGISAGSLMLAQEWIAFASDDGDDGEIFECLGIVPVIVDAHSEDDGWSELRALLRQRPARAAKPTALGLHSRGALRVEFSRRGTCKYQALGVALPRFGRRRGKVVELLPLQPT